MWHFLVATGARRSEVLGLPWADVDLDARTATVRFTVLTTVTGHEVIDDQKSRTSGRTIHLDRRTCDVLKQHRAQQDEHYRLLGIEDPSGLVFTDVHGEFLKPERVTKAFRRLVHAAGVPPIRLHDVRHSHATLLLRAGVNPKVVSERLGHSSVSFTLDTYAHIMPGMQPEAAEQFADLLFGAQEVPSKDDATITEGDAS